MTAAVVEVADPTLTHRASAVPSTHTPASTLLWVAFRVGDGLPAPLCIVPATTGDPVVDVLVDDCAWDQWAAVLQLGVVDTESVPRTRQAVSQVRPVRLKSTVGAS